MVKINKLQNNHYVILSNRIKRELQNNFLYDYLKANFKRIDDLVKKPLKLAVFGEFNAGKTSFINRLLGLNLPTKRVPTTKVITIIKYGENDKFEIEYKDKNSEIDVYSIREYEGLDKLNEILENPSDLIEIKEIRVYINNSILKTFEIIDTPGFNDVEFEKVTKTLFDKVNFAIWVFSAQQAGSNSEKNILEEFKEKSIYKNNIYAFINQADIVDEESIEEIKNSLKQYGDYFMNEEILAISSKKKDDKWNFKFQQLIEDLKTKVLNKDIEISEKQIEEEFKVIKQKLKELKNNFSEINNKLIASFNEFINKYPITMEFKSKKIAKEKIFKQLKEDIKQIKEEVVINEIYESRFLESGIKLLAYYKTIDKLDDIDKNLKKIYLEYINEFQKNFKNFFTSIINLFNNLLIIDKKFDEDTRKKFEKILFTLDMLKETKQLLIVGYIIGVLTDNYIYKNLKEEDILKNLNKDVILNLINLDLDITYFIEEMRKIEQSSNNFFTKQINLLDSVINKE